MAAAIDKNDLRKRFEAYLPDMLRDLSDLVAVNSEWSTPEPGAPFGAGPVLALHKTLDLCSRYGFRTDNCDNYAGAAEYGGGEKTVGILAHLDVVPAGKGWTSDPFKMEVRDGRVFGRGTVDNKGAVIAALYAMRVLRDLGVPLKKKIRLIFGTDEERGSGCMKYYVQHRSLPDLGFTPDGEYPVIYAENGTFWNYLRFPEEDTPILSVEGGEAFNSVISEVVTVLDGKQVPADALRDSLVGEDHQNCPVSIDTGPDGNVRMLVKGIAGHGSTPWKGINAAVSTANILCRFLGEKAGKMMHFLKDIIGREYHGETLGISWSDGFSQDLTVNIGLIRYSPEERHLGVDIRFPVTLTVEKMHERYAKAITPFGLSYELINGDNAHYVPKDSFLVQTLLRVYREVTGDTDTEPLTVGGGTYARAIGSQIVAFGAVFPDREPVNGHRADEHFVIENYLQHCVISCMAICELARDEL